MDNKILLARGIEHLESITFEEACSAFGPGRFQGGEWHGPCPACGSGEDRAWVSMKERPYVHNRRNCCPPGEVLAAMFPFIRENKPRMHWNQQSGDPEEVRYVYPAGETKVVRRNGEDKKQIFWEKRRKGEDPGLFRNHPTEDVVWICEGEKDVLTLEECGLTATCGPNGSSSGIAHLEEYIKSGLRMIGGAILVPDCDDPGRKHASRWAKALDSAGIPWQVADLHGHAKGREGYDVTDALQNGLGGVDELRELLSEVGVLPWDKPPEPQWKLLSNVEVTPIRWLWHPYIPFGELTLMASHGGVGKTTVACAIAAAVSCGQAERSEAMAEMETSPNTLPGVTEALPALRVGIVSVEDNASQIRMKVEMAGGMIEKIYVMAPKEGDFRLDESAEEVLTKFVEDCKLDLLVFDNIFSALPEGGSVIDTSSARAVMVPLRAVAEKTGCAVLALIHSPKQSSGKHGVVSGNMQFFAAARSVLALTAIDDAEGNSSCYMSHNKSNRGMTGPTLEYSLTSTSQADGTPGPAQFSWMGQSHFTAGQLAAASDKPSSKDGETLSTRDVVLENIPPRTEECQGIDINELCSVVMSECDCSKQAINYHLKKLKDDNLVRNHQDGFGHNKKSIWWLSP